MSHIIERLELEIAAMADDFETILVSCNQCSFSSEETTIIDTASSMSLHEQATEHDSFDVGIDADSSQINVDCEITIET